MTSEWLHLHITHYTLQLKDNKIAQSCYLTRNINCIRRQRCYACLTIWSDVAGVLMKKPGIYFCPSSVYTQPGYFYPLDVCLKPRVKKGKLGTTNTLSTNQIFNRPRGRNKVGGHVVILKALIKGI